MSAGRPIITGISWGDVFPATTVARALRVALRLRVLAAATVGIVTLIAADGLVRYACGDATFAWPHTTSIAPMGSAHPGVVAQNVVERFATTGWFIVEPFVAAAYGGDTGFWPSVARCGMRLLILPLLSVGLARIAVLKITRDESPNLIVAGRYALSHRRAAWLTCGLLIGAVGVLSLPLVALRLLLASSYLAGAAWLLGPVILAASAGLAVVAIGAMAGWPLTVCTLATENTDAFDAISRAYSYVYQRPVKLLACVVVAAMTAVAGGMVVDYAIGATLVASQLAHTANAAAAAQFWSGAAGMVSLGYVVAFAVSATSATYLVLRRAIDGVELNDVWLEPTSFGLPAIEISGEAPQAVQLSRAG